MKIIYSASKLVLPVVFAGLFSIASIAYPSMAIANDEPSAQEMKEDKEEMDARKEIKQEANELKEQSNEAMPNTANDACKEEKDKKDKKGKKEKKEKHASEKAHKHARELAVKHKMTNRAPLSAAEHATIKHGNILDSKIPHESVAEPLKSELEGNPEYEWVPEDEWFIVGQDLVRVHKQTKKITSVMRGVFR